MSRIPIVVICGPTGVGKTALSLRIAEKSGAEIVSADSMQIYKGMDIGTAKPTAEEMRGIRHHMIDIVSPSDNYSTGQYVADAAKCIEDINRRGKRTILVGGTGMYIDNLVTNNVFGAPPASEEIRDTFGALFDEIGGQEMIAKLSKFDEETARRLHPNDKKRIVRAFEVYEMTGKSMTEWNKRSHDMASPYDAVFIGLKTQDRQVLYDRINARVDKMFDDGLVEEVKRLIASGVPDDSTAMQAIGYKELASALSGETDIDTAKSLIKQSSRQYAKRQLTWFRRNKSINWFDTDTTTLDDIFDATAHLTKFAL